MNYLLVKLNTSDIIFIVIGIFVFIILLCLLINYLFGNVYSGMSNRYLKIKYSFRKVVFQLDDFASCLKFLQDKYYFDKVFVKDLDNFIMQIKDVNKENYTKEFYILCINLKNYIQISNLNKLIEDEEDKQIYEVIKTFIYSTDLLFHSIEDYNKFINKPINKQLKHIYKFKLIPDYKKELEKENEKQNKKK